LCFEKQCGKDIKAETNCDKVILNQTEVNGIIIIKEIVGNQIYGKKQIIGIQNIY